MSKRFPSKPVAVVVIVLISLAAAWLVREKFPGRSAESRTVKGVTSGSVLTVHLSGLLLIVPPAAATGSTHIVLPFTGGFPAHRARLIYQGPNLEVCHHYEPTTKRCTVSLEDWSLEPLGEGGTVKSSTLGELPKGMVDLATASKNPHGVDPPKMENEGRGRVVARFATGRARSSTCSLALWYFEAQPSQPFPIANVVSWDIRVPQNRIELAFNRRKGRPLRIVVPFNGGTRVALTNDPVLRPHDPKDAAHFEALYRALEHSANYPGPIPKFSKTLDPSPCAAPIGPPGVVGPVVTVDTYSCLVAASKPKGGEI